MSHYQTKELLRVVRNGNVKRLNTLLDKGIEVNFLYRKTGMTPLMTAAYAGHAAIVQALLGSGASINLTADDGASALHWASCNGYIDIVNILLRAGADVNMRREEDGPTPLHMALSNGHESIALALIDAGTNLDIKYLDMTIIEYVEWGKQDAIVKHIRENIIYRTNNF